MADARPWGILTALLAALLLSAPAAAVRYPVADTPYTQSGALDPGAPQVVIATDFGNITLTLRPGVAPITVGNFIDLAESGFYDGLTFHRVVADFVIQGGDPNGDGSGGSGTTIPWEDTGLTNDAYTIAMARSNPNDATSQFYINLQDNPHLDRPAQQFPFVVFGEVDGGRDVVDAIGAVPTDPQDRPIDPVVMHRVLVHRRTDAYEFRASAGDTVRYNVTMDAGECLTVRLVEGHGIGQEVPPPIQRGSRASCAGDFRGGFTVASEEGPTFSLLVGTDDRNPVNYTVTLTVEAPAPPPPPPGPPPPAEDTRFRDVSLVVVLVAAGAVAVLLYRFRRELFGSL